MPPRIGHCWDTETKTLGDEAHGIQGGVLFTGEPMQKLGINSKAL
jgi:hypothetical protein